MKTYVEISVEKELPKGVGSYFTIDEGFRSGIEGVKIKTTNFIGVNKRFGSPIHENYKTVYWLKEFSLPELMEEYASYCVGSQDSDMELTAIEFLTQKGIL